MKRTGSSGRTRTYNPSVNSRTASSHLTLQTQDLDAHNSDFPGNWGDSGGTAGGTAIARRLLSLVRGVAGRRPRSVACQTQVADKALTVPTFF